jgi:K+-sensing histidine kinase KdpD
MNDEAPQTFFASPERATPEAVAAQHQKLASDTMLTRILDSFPEPGFILNRQRQIVLANDKLAALLNRTRESVIGLRPGEAFDCVHSTDPPGGCGTTPFCRYCGAANAIVHSQESGAPDTQECRIVSAFEGRMSALDLRVWATPLSVDDEEFTIFAIRDTTAEKRREALERLFFHDVLNSVGALKGITEILPGLSGQEAAEMTQRISAIAAQVVEEIESQRDLTAAERGDLRIKVAAVDVALLLDRICAQYSRHSVAQGKTIAAPKMSGAPTFQSDEVLLGRVLGNLVKNALEASGPGQTVTVSYENGGIPAFHVHNESVMPADVQAQIFQRSFSTKGDPGRGLGAYGVKLLTENYLRGTVTFSSTTEAGTTFTVRLPHAP